MDAFTSNDMICKILILLNIFLNVSNVTEVMWCVNFDFVVPKSHIQLAEILLRPTISTDCRGCGQVPWRSRQEKLGRPCKEISGCHFFNLIKRVFATDLMADRFPPIYDKFG